VTSHGSVLAELVSEPLYHASRGSKELFHSDLLAWMARTFPDVAARVFAPWLVPSADRREHRVRREFHRLDLLIELPGFRPLVIENKTFALPDEEQLRRYTEEAVRVLDKPSFLLLGLCDPGWPSGRAEFEGQPWPWMSYGVLGERLATEFDEGGGFSTDVLHHEARLAGMLHRIVGDVAIRTDDEPFELSSAARAQLDEAGLLDAVGKVRAHQAGRLIQRRLEDEEVRAPAWALEVGFTRKQPLLAGFWRVQADVFAGWQFQGRDWRLALLLQAPDLLGKDRHENRATVGREHVAYFDFDDMTTILGLTQHLERSAQQQVAVDGFNGYAPDMIYRYRRPPALTVWQLVDLAVFYSRRAANWRL
jgi:hypothetical protein